MSDAAENRSTLIGMTGGLYGFDATRDSAPRLLLPGVQPTAFAVDPSEPSRIYCSTYNRGLWRSTDAGETWLPIGTPQNYYRPPAPGAIAQRETTFVSVEPRPGPHGQHAVWVGTEPSNLYRSEDNGETFLLVTGFEHHRSRRNWSYPPRPSTHHVRWIAHGGNGNIYVSVEFGALLRSVDGGATFEDRRDDSPLDTHVLLTHPLAPERVYAALGDGLMTPGRSFAESRNGGETWRYSGRGLGDMVYLYGMAINASDPDDIRIAAASSPHAAHNTGPASIFRRDGDSWVKDADGFPSEDSLIPVLAAEPQRPGSWLALSNRGLFTKKNGDRWRKLSEGDGWQDMHPMSLAVLTPH